MFKNIENENKAKYNSFYTNSNAEIIINESDINDVFELIFRKRLRLDYLFSH